MYEISKLNQKEKQDIYLLSNFYRSYKKIDPLRGEIFFKNIFIHSKWTSNFFYLIQNSDIVNVKEGYKYDIDVHQFYKNYNLFHLPLFVSGINSIDSIKKDEILYFPRIDEINKLYFKEDFFVNFVEVIPPKLETEQKIINEINLETEWLQTLLKEGDL